ncbi:MAG: hypothetical protein O3A79_03850 [Candidatus Marinimicrobia bacterium]|nr:hypothetical protein [Candidatus Neomarinimicrobiota bacterium]
MAESVLKSYFPSQTASDDEKLSQDYGLKVARAIENEWFKKDRGVNRFFVNQNQYHKLRLYARGEQSIQKYKDELSINGDLSYLNLDWKPVPIIPKFVDIVVNGIAERTYDIKAFSQDPFGVSKRTSYMQNILADMRTKEFTQEIKDSFGFDLGSMPAEELPDNEEELQLHMQLNYKQAVEIAEEQAIQTVFNQNNYENIKKRLFYDLTVLGIGCVKNNFTQSEGIKIEYVDPANIVHSYSESPYYDDIYYIGEIKNINVNDLKMQFPNLTDEDLKKITQQGSQDYNTYNKYNTQVNNKDNNSVQIMYFNYKTYMNEVYKIKETATGAEKIIKKSDAFMATPIDGELRFERIAKNIEVLYEGVFVPGSNILLEWKLADNMLREKSDVNKVKLNYSLVSPRVYNGRIESLVSRVTGFADMIQLTHLKIQQVLSRMVPDGVYLDADGLAEIDLGNGTNYNPQEALNMFFQTGSVIGRSFTSEGDMNPGKVPIQEISNNAGANKLAQLISTYNYYMQMIRDATGLNEARDGSTPDKNALVGVQKLAAANSNTATRHILQAGLFLTAETAEKISLRISDVLEYSPTRNAFIQSIGAHNVATLQELSELHLYDFGIFLELAPDEEEKQILENNIQVAIGQQNIDLDDAIDIRQIKNVKLANQLLKLRRRKKLERDQRIQQQNIQAQAQANAQAQQVAAQAEVQKQQALTQSKIELESAKSQMEMQRLQTEKEMKKELMQLEFQINMQLQGMAQQASTQQLQIKEDAKAQKQTAKPFESSGNDILSGGFGLGAFEPK